MNDNTIMDHRTARQILEDHAREHGIEIAFEVVRPGRKRGHAGNPWTPARRAAKAVEYDARLRAAQAVTAAIRTQAEASRGGALERVWARELKRAEAAERRAAGKLAAMRQVPDNIVGL